MTIILLYYQEKMIILNNLILLETKKRNKHIEEERCKLIRLSIPIGCACPLIINACLQHDSEGGIFYPCNCKHIFPVRIFICILTPLERQCNTCKPIPLVV